MASIRRVNVLPTKAQLAKPKSLTRWSIQLNSIRTQPWVAAEEIGPVAEEVVAVIRVDVRAVAAFSGTFLARSSSEAAVIRAAVIPVAADGAEAVAAAVGPVVVR